jgi:N6-adenosine-specific RNA methylase IME4
LRGGRGERKMATIPPKIAAAADVKTDKYGSKIDPLTKDEYDLLKKSIAENGLYHPITINQHDDVLDGHHRLKVCQELRIKPEFEVKEFDDELLEEIFVIDTNVARRQLSAFRRGELLLSKKKPVLEKIAKQNMSLAGKGVKSFTPLERVNEELARQAGMSHMQLHKVETIMEKAPEDLKEKVRSGKTTINNAYTQVIRAEDRNKPKPAPPEGQYEILYVDPPWTYEIPGRGTPENHYPVMSDDEIMTLPVPAAENAILFLWTTYPQLDTAIDITRAWGFTYRSNLVWVKDKFGTGFYFRGQHELLLLGVKGNGLGVPAEVDRHSSVLFAPRMEHSRKPAKVYELIEAMYPGRTRLEMFARGEAREGWKTWGLEAATAALALTPPPSSPKEEECSDNDASSNI